SGTTRSAWTWITAIRSAWRRRPAWASRRRTSRTTWSPRSAKTSTRSTRAALGRHCRFIIDSSSRDHQPTLLAVAGVDHLAILATSKCSFPAVQSQFGLRAILSMTPKTRGLEDRSNVFVVGKACPFCRRWNFSEVEFAEVELFAGEDRG